MAWIAGALLRLLAARLWILSVAIKNTLKLVQLLSVTDDKDSSTYWTRCRQLLHTAIRSLAVAVASALLLTYFGQPLIDDNFFPLTVVHCVQKFIKMEDKKGDEKRASKKDDEKRASKKDDEKRASECSIGYGAGIACSFYEGYLSLVLPNDGAKFYGLEETINTYESIHRVVFPVKKLFLIITKSLYCPPDLKMFNKPDRTRPFLEGCASLEEQIRNVAGVKGRIYKNSPYMIHRLGKDPVYLVAECATPLHTLYKVKERRAVYEELVDADFDLIVKEFCEMLEKILEVSRECYRKCVLVHYDDDADKDLNVAELLLQKIEELEPQFEQLIA